MVRIGNCFRPLFDDSIVQQHRNEWQKKKNGARAAVDLFTAADVIDVPDAALC